MRRHPPKTAFFVQKRVVSLSAKCSRGLTFTARGPRYFCETGEYLRFRLTTRFICGSRVLPRLSVVR